MFEKELDYFINNQADLFQKYPNRILVIKGETVLGDYPDYRTAYFTALSEHKAGTFMLQKCGPDKMAFTVNICSFELA